MGREHRNFSCVIRSKCILKMFYCRFVYLVRKWQDHRPNGCNHDTDHCFGPLYFCPKEKRLRPNSESIAMLKDHMMKSTLTDLRLTREWGQQRSSTAISRMVRRLAASCPKDSQITVPSLLLRQQQSHWH